jgi:putative phage-type endonuclease
MQAVEILNDLKQGTSEWFDLRKSKITATDAVAIMGVSPWKTKYQLYQEKKSNSTPSFVNEGMKSGIELEPLARSLFVLKTGLFVEPKVVVKDWAMASLDGIDPSNKHVVEIKCSGEKYHQLAMQGKIPDHYYPQLQHQMYVCDVESMDYFSFDGIDGITVKVKRDEEYIAKMIEEELKFFECLKNNTPPENEKADYIERNDSLWQQCASKWISVSESLKELEKEEQQLREQLIFLSGESNTKGAGISLCQVQRKGNIDYSKIPELSSIDLEKFRKKSTSSWRITQN